MRHIDEWTKPLKCLRIVPRELLKPVETYENIMKLKSILLFKVIVSLKTKEFHFP